MTEIANEMRTRINDDIALLELTPDSENAYFQKLKNTQASGELDSMIATDLIQLHSWLQTRLSLMRAVRELMILTDPDNHNAHQPGDPDLRTAELITTIKRLDPSYPFPWDQIRTSQNRHAQHSAGSQSVMAANFYASNYRSPWGRTALMFISLASLAFLLTLLVA